MSKDIIDILKEQEGVKTKDGWVFEKDLNLHNLKLKNLPKIFKVGGNFHCCYNELDSLKGCPKSVGGGFYCQYNNLTSLRYCPEIVGGEFICDGNKLSSLEGCPKIIGRRSSFDCSRNKLTSLEGCPKISIRYLTCSNNKLTSLDGCKITWDGVCICHGNYLKQQILNGTLVADKNGLLYLIIKYDSICCYYTCLHKGKMIGVSYYKASKMGRV